MKACKLILSNVAVLFLFGCGGDDSGSSTVSPPVSNQEEPVIVETGVTSGITENLVVPEDFDFSSESEVAIELTVASNQLNRGFLSVYTDKREGVVDYNSQVIRTPVQSGQTFESVIMLPNHSDSIWVEVWYPTDLDSTIKQNVEVVDGVAKAQL